MGSHEVNSFLLILPQGAGGQTYLAPAQYAASEDKSAVYRTRHTYISESIAAGVKPEVLKLVVGHANYSTSVETYGKNARMEVMQQEVKKSF